MLSRYHIERLAKAVHEDYHDEGVNESTYQIGRLTFIVEYNYHQYVTDPGDFYMPPDYSFCISVNSVSVWIGQHIVELDYADVDKLQACLEEYYGYEPF